MHGDSPERALVERALVERARSGDRCAFDELLSAYDQRVRALAASRLGERLRGHIELDDVMQETFSRAFERIGGFRWKDEKRDTFFGWLSGIAINVIRTAAKEQKRRGLPAFIDGADGRHPPASKLLRRDERFDRLRDALARLKPDQREVIQLVRIEGKSISEAAERLNKSSNAISILLLRATRRLRELFGETDSFGLPDRTLARDEEPDELGHGD